MELWPYHVHCWWGPGNEVVWCPPSLMCPVLQTPVRRAVLGRGWWQGQSQPGHPQVLPRVWPVSGWGGSVPSAGGWLDPSDNAPPEPRGIMCMGDWVRLIPGLSLGLAIFHKAFSKVALVCHVGAQPDSSGCFLLDKIIPGTLWAPAGCVNLHSVMIHLWPQTLFSVRNDTD